MTLPEIYTKYRRGSYGFVQAVQDHCGFDSSAAVIQAIAELAETADDFQRIWEDGDTDVEERAREIEGDDSVTLLWGKHSF